MNVSTMIAGAVAVSAALCSFSVKSEWELGTDSIGFKHMYQKDADAGTSIAFGYDGSSDCTDIRLLFVNYFPQGFRWSIPENSTRLEIDGEVINLPALQPSRKAFPEFVAFTYMYTPTDRLINAFISDNSDFYWSDNSLTEPAMYSNSNFVEQLNIVVNHCIEMGVPEAPEDEGEVL